MLKRYANLSFTYAIIGLLSGVFFREFTKLNHYTGKTSLSAMHTHYLTLGAFFFLILLLLEKSFAFSSQKHVNKALIIYNIGLNISSIGFLIRGITEVRGTDLSKAFDASISGIAGIGHILLSFSMVYLLLKVRKKIG